MWDGFDGTSSPEACWRARFLGGTVWHCGKYRSKQARAGNFPLLSILAQLKAQACFISRPTASFSFSPEMAAQPAISGFLKLKVELFNRLFSQEVFMPDQVTKEVLYAGLEEIRRRAEIIRDTHHDCLFGASIGRYGAHCLAPIRPHNPGPACGEDKPKITPAEVFLALQELANLLQEIMRDYAEFYKLKVG
jgi:hypothetical protein